MRLSDLAKKLWERLIHECIRGSREMSCLYLFAESSMPFYPDNSDMVALWAFRIDSKSF